MLHIKKRSNFEEKRKNVNSINQLTTDSWLKKLIISWITSRFLNRSKYRASRSSKGLLKMIINYADSYEFLQGPFY